MKRGEFISRPYLKLLNKITIWKNRTFEFLIIIIMAFVTIFEYLVARISPFINTILTLICQLSYFAHEFKKAD
ncbi:MAG TPA: hypothetical protein DEG09_11740 [Marinilabiliaceae bacterium]|nr:hypothetical protein [Marinilabiliaceae bacterium]